MMTNDDKGGGGVRPMMTVIMMTPGRGEGYPAEGQLVENYVG